MSLFWQIYAGVVIIISIWALLAVWLGVRKMDKFLRTTEKSRE